MILIFCCRDLLKKNLFFQNNPRVRFFQAYQNMDFLQIFQKPKQLVLCLWTARSTNSQLATPMDWRAAKRKRGSRRQSRARRRCHAAPEQQRSGARRRRSLQSRYSGGSPRRAMRRHQLATTEAFFTTWDTVGKKPYCFFIKRQRRAIVKLFMSLSGHIKKYFIHSRTEFVPTFSCHSRTDLDNVYLFVLSKLQDKH